MMGLLEQYSQNYELLSKTERYCIDTCLREIDSKKFTIQSLATHLTVSTTTFFRMIKKLGYHSFNDFKYDFLLEKEKQESLKKISKNTILDNLLQDSNKTIAYLAASDTQELVTQIKNSRKLLICSSGLTSHIGKILARKLSINNIEVFLETDTYLMLMKIAQMNHQDSLVLLSKEGETVKLLSVCKKAKMNGLSVILISEIGNSSLTALADYKLNVAHTTHLGTDIDTRLQLHIAIEYLTKLLIYD